MRTQNDGRGRLGGRVAGVKNRQITLSDVATKVVSKYRKMFEEDLRSLNPEKRATLLTQLMCHYSPASIGAPETNEVEE